MNVNYVREKLVDLLLKEDDVCKPNECKDCGADGSCYYHRTADKMIDHGVTVQEWHSVNECMPEDLEENKGKKVINCIVEHDPYSKGKTTAQFRQRKYDKYYDKWCWSKIGGHTVIRWTMMPQPPKGD